MGSFSKIAKWALIGAGSVLSLIPAVGPVVGGGMIAAGVGIKTDDKTTTSLDPVSNAAAALGQALNNASAYGATSSGASVINTNTMINNFAAWVKNNIVFVILGIAAIIFVPRLLKKK